jgi:hypothetical protein
MVNSRILPFVQRLGLEPFDPQHPGGERDPSAFEQSQCFCKKITCPRRIRGHGKRPATSLQGHQKALLPEIQTEEVRTSAACVPCHVIHPFASQLPVLRYMFYTSWSLCTCEGATLVHTASF